MKLTTVKGTFDYLPREVRVRDYLQAEILRTYLSCGYERIATPILEDIENLDKSDGGENLNLIFKVLKRGEKLDKALAGEGELADLGLRYDLTLPLSRYFACNRTKLMSPMKVIQMDQVFRAERPQKGRLRQFVQCDIDIVGSDSPSCEIELIDTTAKALANAGIRAFKIRINDRRILGGVLAWAGFAENDRDSVSITFDKLDKVGPQGVVQELREKGFDEKAIVRFEGLLHGALSLEQAAELCPDPAPAKNLQHIIDCSRELAAGKYEVEYDLSLVRGQGYYTGPVFEVVSTDFGGSIAGGGRYDRLIGKFLGEDIPAVGFSIGFERIASILLDQGFAIPGGRRRCAVLHEEEDAVSAVRYADTLRGTMDTALFVRPKKTGKFLDKLKAQGFSQVHLLEPQGPVRTVNLEE